MLNYRLPWIYRVQGDSMSPTLQSDDVLLVGRLRGRNPVLRRGDIVVVDASGSSEGFRYYVKRVVGMPCERVTLRDGLLMINEEHFREPYLNGLPACSVAESGSWQLGNEEYFVMGDNRTDSADSRAYGPVTAILARVSRTIWPPRRWHRF